MPASSLEDFIWMDRPTPGGDWSNMFITASTWAGWQEKYLADKGYADV
jgi:hypothetical protein